MGKEFLKSGDAKTEKREFYSSESTILMGDANIDKIVKPEEFPCAKQGS